MNPVLLALSRSSSYTPCAKSMMYRDTAPPDEYILASKSFTVGGKVEERSLQELETDDELWTLLFAKNRSLHDLLARATVDVLVSQEADAMKATNMVHELRLSLLSYFTAMIELIGRLPEACHSLLQSSWLDKSWHTQSSST